MKTVFFYWKLEKKDCVWYTKDAEACNRCYYSFLDWKSSHDVGIWFNKNFFFSCVISILYTSFEHWVHLISMKNHLSGWYDILAMLDHQSCCGEKKYFFLMATPSLLPLRTAGPSMGRGRGHYLCLSITPWMGLPGFQVLSRNYEWAGLWTSLGKLCNNSPFCVST